MRVKTVNKFDLSIIAVLVISFILFVLYPFVMIFIYGMKGNLVSIFLQSKSYYLKLLTNSLKVASGTTIVTAILSVFIAIFYFISKNAVKKLMVLIFMIAMISPPFVTSLSYINLFGRRGLITYNLLGLNYDPYGFLGIVSMQSVTHIAINVLLLIGFINGINYSVINSARSLGANTNRVILDALIPLMKPAMKVVVLLTFIRSVADFTTPAIVGGKYNVLSTEGYLAFIAEGDVSKAVILNFIILLPSLLVFLLFSKSLKNVVVENRGVAYSGLNIEKKGLIYRLSALASIITIFILVSLYGAIVLSAFTTMEYGKLVFTLQNFIDTNEYISGVFLRSIIYALIAGGVASIVGHILQYYIQIQKIKSLKIIDFIATLPYILPGTFYGLGYVLAFNSYPLKITGTALIVILNLIFKQMPFASRIGYSSVSQVPLAQLKAARDLGGKRLDELKDVVLPLTKQGLFVSFINGFNATITTIGSIIFLVYPSQKVATLVMFDVIESGKYDIGSVIAFYIIMICLSVNVLYYLILNRKR